MFDNILKQGKVEFFMNSRAYFRDFWLPLTLTEFGFLWSVFLAAWGPVLRYLGWFLALIGIGYEFYKGHARESGMHFFVKAALLFILLWGLPVTFIIKPDLYLFAKGYSLALEFAFSVWLAARIYSQEMLKKFWIVFSVSIVLAVSHTVFNFLQDGNFAGLFSNINTLGIYGVIVMPFALSRAFEKNGLISWFLAIAVLFVVCLSSSSAAWITAVFSIFIMTLLGGKRRLIKVIFLGVSFLFVFAGIWAGLSRFDPKLASGFESYMRREINQLMSYNDAVKFSTNRSHIWQGALNLLKERPFTGWGWGEFNEPFAQINKNWWDQKKFGMNLEHQSDAHNMYLNLAVYGGIPTFFAVVALFLFSICRSFEFYRKKISGFEWFWLATCATIFSQLVYSLAGDVFSARNTFACVFWYLMGFVSISNDNLNREKGKS